MIDKNEYKLATINVEHYLNEVANNNYAKNDYLFLKNNYLKKQKRLFGFYKFNESFSNTMSIYGNEENIMTTTKFNYDEFITKIGKILNIKNNNREDTLRIKINELKEIKSIDELKNQFPLIYEDYIQGNILYKSFETQFDFQDLTSNDNNKKMQKATKDKDYYYNCGLRFHLPYFINNQVSLYENIANNLNNLKEYINNNSLQFNNYYINPNKKKLYLINKYVDNALICKSKEIKIIYLHLVNNYLLDEEDNNTFIHDEDGNKIGYKDILIKFRQLLNDNKELEEYIVDWVLLPEGKSTQEKTKIADKVTIHLNPNISKYITANNRKLKFYEENPYNKAKCLGKAKGISINKGYTAYIYENGEILLDKIATSSNLISSFGNAIYNQNVYNFEKISKINKTTLRKNKICPFIIHDENWEKNAQKIIDIPTTEENKREAKKLVKRLKKKSMLIN